MRSGIDEIAPLAHAGAEFVVFLELNDVRATAASNYDVFELVMEVASSHVELTTLAERLRRMVTEETETD